MSGSQYSCGKCGGNMVRGFATDQSDQYYFKQSWVDGDPEQVTFLGMKTGKVNIKDRVLRDIRGFRCEKCGLLELFAD